MILHPLKSELNWPLGKRKPLDYGASRWAIPFHLLDALFYCDPSQETPRMPERWKGNGAAQALLDRLRAAVHLGLERKVLQRTPHLILLSRPFYTGQLKPLLCRWMLLWVRKSRLRELKDEEVLAYMMHGARAHPDTTALVERMLTDKFVKMLNLSHAWLDQLLPHVLPRALTLARHPLSRTRTRACARARARAHASNPYPYLYPAPLPVLPPAPTLPPPATVPPPRV